MRIVYLPFIFNSFALILAIECVAIQHQALPAARQQKQDLPGESALPGRITRALPSEAQLPNSSQAARPKTGNEKPNSVETRPGKESPSTSTRIQRYLPSESVIPSQTSSSRPTENSNLRPKPLAKSDSQPTIQPEVVTVEKLDSLQLDQKRPWLRLNAGGPTAPLKTVAFTQDSRHLLAGGDDKALHVWSMVNDPSAKKNSWTYNKSVLWQVQRGPRGAINAIGVDQNQIAFAGIGATSLTGEVSLVDPSDFRFQRALYNIESGPRAAISRLAIEAIRPEPSIAKRTITVNWHCIIRRFQRCGCQGRCLAVGR